MKAKTKSRKVNRAWLNDHVNDPYVKLANREGYRARAAYKLKEIDEMLGLIKPGHLVVDLGSTPGAWSQYLRRKLSPGGAAMGQLDGTIIALDILPMQPIEGVVFLPGDFREPEVLEACAGLLDREPADRERADRTRADGDRTHRRRTARLRADRGDRAHLRAEAARARGVANGVAGDARARPHRAGDDTRVGRC